MTNSYIHCAIYKAEITQKAKSVYNVRLQYPQQRIIQQAHAGLYR